MVSASSHTTAATLTMGLAILASPEGQAVQQKAYQAIQGAYPGGDAWSMCLVEEKVPYITALVKEALRYWVVIPMCLPRKSIQDISYHGATIPAGTTFFMVSHTYAHTRSAVGITY
jgi:phenylacetate 2-hydroxylase